MIPSRVSGTAKGPRPAADDMVRGAAPSLVRSVTTRIVARLQIFQTVLPLPVPVSLQAMLNADLSSSCSPTASIANLRMEEKK